LAIPTRLLKELNEIAARYNLQSEEHAIGCCRVDRRFVRDIWAALADETNWLEEPTSVQIARLQDQIDRIKAAQPEAAPRRPPAEAVYEEEPQQTPPFPPPPVGDE